LFRCRKKVKKDVPAAVPAPVASPSPAGSAQQDSDADSVEEVIPSGQPNVRVLSDEEAGGDARGGFLASYLCCFICRQLIRFVTLLLQQYFQPQHNSMGVGENVVFSII
jgi:hypothetical protein